MEALALTLVFFVLAAVGFVILARTWPTTYGRTGYRLSDPGRSDVAAPEERDPPRWRTESGQRADDPADHEGDAP